MTAEHHHFSYEEFQRHHEGPLYEFVRSRLATNLHVPDAARLWELSDCITFEAFVLLYRRWHLFGEAEGEAQDGLYKAAAWLCDGP